MTTKTTLKMTLKQRTINLKMTQLLRIEHPATLQLTKPVMLENPLIRNLLLYKLKLINSSNSLKKVLTQLTSPRTSSDRLDRSLPTSVRQTIY